MLIRATKIPVQTVPNTFLIVDTSSDMHLVTTNLPFWNRRDPAACNVDSDVYDANYPESMGVVSATSGESENDGEDDTAQIATASRQARDNAVRKGVDVRDQREVGAVAGLEEDGHQGNEAEHGALVVRVRLANDDEHQASDDTADVNPGFLKPQIASAKVVQEIRDDATQWAGDEIEEAEHGCPVGRAGLAQGREVLQVIGA